MNQAKKVLVVEDDESLLKILTDGITSRGLIAIRAADGEQALQQVQENEPDLILLDLLLPKLDGFQVLESIRKNPNPRVAATPVIVLSNLWSNKDILRIRALHIEEYYVKANTDLQDVYKKVDAVLASQQQKAI